MACSGGVCSINRSNRSNPVMANNTNPAVYNPSMMGGYPNPGMNNFGNAYPVQMGGSRQVNNNSGGFWSGVKNFFAGTPGSIEQTPRFTPEQQQAMSNALGYSQQQLGQQPNALQALQALQQGGYQPTDTQSLINQLLGRIGNQGDFAPIAQKYKTQFQQETIPSIAERFTQLGSQGSSAFAQRLGGAGANLAENLAAQEAQFGQQNRNMDIGLLQALLGNRLGSQNLQQNLAESLGRIGLGQQNTLQNLMSMGLQPQFETSYFGGQPGVLQQGAQKGSDLAVKLLGAYLGMA